MGLGVRVRVRVYRSNDASHEHCMKSVDGSEAVVGAAWERGEMGKGRNGKGAKWQWGELGIAWGRNGKGPNGNKPF